MKDVLATLVKDDGFIVRGGGAILVAVLILIAAAMGTISPVALLAFLLLSGILTLLNIVGRPRGMKIPDRAPDFFETLDENFMPRQPHHERERLDHCPKCGARISPDWRHCRVCSYPV